jgi:hypothetical protein
MTGFDVVGATDWEQNAYVSQLWLASADMVRLTGLSPDFLEANDLRIPLGPFSTELLRDQHLMTSRLDSRFAGYQQDGAATNTAFDFSNSNIEDSFLSAFEQYVYQDLKFDDNNLYYVSGNNPQWSGAYNTVVNLEDGFANPPPHAPVRRHGLLRLRLPVLPRRMDHRAS